MKEDLSLLSTGDLEKAARYPRGPEDARAIAEELADRRRLYSDGGGTMSLFEKQEEARLRQGYGRARPSVPLGEKGDA